MGKANSSGMKKDLIKQKVQGEKASEPGRGMVQVWEKRKTELEIKKGLQMPNHAKGLMGGGNWAKAKNGWLLV